MLIDSSTWVLIDFGCCTKIGEQMPLAFTPAYAAPETVAAKYKHVRVVVAAAEVDAWALGVIAFELFVEKCLFAFQTADQVRKQHKPVIDIVSRTF